MNGLDLLLRFLLLDKLLDERRSPEQRETDRIRKTPEGAQIYLDMKEERKEFVRAEKKRINDEWLGGKLSFKEMRRQMDEVKRLQRQVPVLSERWEITPQDETSSEILEMLFEGYEGRDLVIARNKLAEIVLAKDTPQYSYLAVDDTDKMVEQLRAEIALAVVKGER